MFGSMLIVMTDKLVMSGVGPPRDDLPPTAA
jgi:hypothetical protein